MSENLLCTSCATIHNNIEHTNKVLLPILLHYSSQYLWIKKSASTFKTFHFSLQTHSQNIRTYVDGCTFVTYCTHKCNSIFYTQYSTQRYSILSAVIWQVSLTTSDGVTDDFADTVLPNEKKSWHKSILCLATLSKNKFGYSYQRKYISND